MCSLKLKYSVTLEISRSTNKLSQPFLHIGALLGTLKNVPFTREFKSLLNVIYAARHNHYL